VERQLKHRAGEAEKFNRELAARGVSVRVGMEATGYSRWFERLLAELGIEVSIGDAAEIKTERIRKQKTDREANATSDAPPSTTDHRLLEAIFFVARMTLHYAGFGNYKRQGA
jgi:transposase